MNKFTMLVGVAGCGKSTLAEEFRKMGAFVVSSDAIRGELWGDENDQLHNQKVFEEAHRRIKYLLKSGYWVVFDATNLSARRRENFLKELRKFDCEKECVVILTPFDVIMERMEYRTRKVPAHIVHKQICSFQCPHYYEGWDSIKLIWDVTCINEDVNDYLKLCEMTKNDNHNHSTEMIMDHIDNAVLYFAINYSKRKDFDVKIVEDAIKYHDIGKPQTKVFHNAKGEPTEEAHYYGHQNYSAYLYLITHPDYMIHEERIRHRLDVANLIQFHMEHFFRAPEALHKFYTKIGFGKELEVIHTCDMEGH